MNPSIDIQNGIPLCILLKMKKERVAEILKFCFFLIFKYMYVLYIYI